MGFKKEPAAFEIKAPNFNTVEVTIVGNAPLMVHKFSTKMRGAIEEKQTAKDKVKKARAPKDYAAEFNGARYISQQGWDGVYAGAIRSAMISAARFSDGLPMTRAKGLLFIVADGFDRDDGTPLVRILGDKPAHDTRPVRLESGVADLRNRPRYDNWSMNLKISYDADLLTANDVLNLLERAGKSIGICEGRPSSPNSYGCGFGTFNVKGKRATKRVTKKKAKPEAIARANGHDEVRAS